MQLFNEPKINLESIKQIAKTDKTKAYQLLRKEGVSNPKAIDVVFEDLKINWGKVAEQLSGDNFAEYYQVLIFGNLVLLYELEGELFGKFGKVDTPVWSWGMEDVADDKTAKKIITAFKEYLVKLSLLWELKNK